MIDRGSACAMIALALGGCTQLVAFGQPVVGAPDVVEQEAVSGGPLCDPEIAVGESAVCDASCVIQRGVVSEGCPRVTLSGGRARVDVAALHEVEITIEACASGARPVRITGENGASVSIERGTLHVRPAREAAARPVRREDYLPDRECVERSLILQTGRMELAQEGIRMCSAHLVPVEGAWQIELGEGLERVELCLRAAR